MARVLALARVFALLRADAVLRVVAFLVVADPVTTEPSAGMRVLPLNLFALQPCGRPRSYGPEMYCVMVLPLTVA